MSDWQPAVVTDAHLDWGPPLNSRWVKYVLGRRVEVRELPEKVAQTSTYRTNGCDGKIFEIRPLGTELPGEVFTVCEHQLLTD